MIEAANILLNKGIKEIIVTLGSKGALHIDNNGYKFFPAYKVRAIDTTAAGDSFIGGFVSSYIEHKDMEKAIDRGTKNGSISNTKK